MTPDRRLFDAAQRAGLEHTRDSLLTGWLKYSEWAVKTPSGMRLRVGWDPRFEQLQPTAHRSEL